MRAFQHSRRGRPRRAAANDNHPAGNNPPDKHPKGARHDPGTAELQMKRAQLARGLDPALCAHPLDLLLARGWIPEAQHRAGWRYAGLYRRIHGSGAVSYNRFYEGIGGAGCDTRRAPAPDEAALAREEALYRRAKAELVAAGVPVARLTEAVCVFSVWPGFIFAAEGERSVACARLRLGLGLLAASFAVGVR